MENHRVTSPDQAKRRMLDRPIVIIGAARSGTTLLGNLLSQHSDVAYWVEPKYIWRYRNPTSKTDIRTRKEAAPQVKRYIRSRFACFTRRQSKMRFMEKTPSNCLRVPFVHEVLPDARFIHIVRDGRDVALSAYRKWTSPPKKDALWRRLTKLDIPLRDIPYYTMDFLRDVVGRQLRPERAFIWGPHVPNLAEVKERLGVLPACGYQWKESVRAARDGLKQVPEDQQLEIRFERLVQEPQTLLCKMLAFAELRAEGSVLRNAANMVRPEACDRWRSEAKHRVDQLSPIIGPTLKNLGYVKPC
jgi:hypothetical protein